MTRPAYSEVGLISNPNSGHNRDAFARIEALVAGQPAIHHVVTHSPADIESALEALSRRQVKVLAINGGDGTAAAILGRMLERAVFVKPPLIALLPGGTANMNAGDVGIRGRLVPCLARWIFSLGVLYTRLGFDLAGFVRCLDHSQHLSLGYYALPLAAVL